MSKARRVELEDITIRNNYFNRLIEAKHILLQRILFLSQTNQEWIMVFLG